MARYREVREEPAFTRAITEIAKRHPRVREVEAALSWSLARAPQDHYQVPGTRYHIVQTLAYDDAPNIPALTVLYWFDDEQVTLVSARLAADTIAREP